MGNNITRPSTLNWLKPEAYLGDKLDSSEVPKIITESLFYFSGELIDPQGNSIEPEIKEDTFMNWLEGLRPQSEVVSYSSEKVPYLLAVYEAVPAWLGCDENFMEDEYGYTPMGLKDAFAKQEGPSAEKIESILSNLMKHAQRVTDEYKAQKRPGEDPAIGDEDWPPRFDR